MAPRVKIERPRNAAPNTAFTQVSSSWRTTYGDVLRKIRIAMDPSDLADASHLSTSLYEVRGPVIYAVDSENNPPGLLHVSCRSPEKLRSAYYKQTKWSTKDVTFLVFEEPQQQ